MMMYIFVPLLSPFRISLYYDLYDCSDDFCTFPRVCCQTDSKLPKSLLKLSLAEVIGHTLTLQHFVLMLMLEALSSCLDRFLPGSVLRSVMMLILFSTARMQCRYMVDNVIQNKSLSYTRSYSVLPWAREWVLRGTQITRWTWMRSDTRIVLITSLSECPTTLAISVKLRCCTLFVM